MSKATAWQVNGDYSTRCIKAERDIVIPSRSRNTPALVDAFGDLASVTPVHDRKHLAFFAGGMRGFGALARTRLGCGRAFGDPDAEVLYQAYAAGSNYLDTLNQAKFCLLPRGIPAWCVVPSSAVVRTQSIRAQVDAHVRGDLRRLHTRLPRRSELLPLR
jgi:hypothetical protein